MNLTCLADLSCLSAIDPDNEVFISKELGECLGLTWDDEDVEDD